MNRLLKSCNWLVLFGLIGVAALLAMPLFAQGNSPGSGNTITVTGPMSFANDQITVAGYIIAPAGAFQPSQYNEGDVVTITGDLLPDGITIQVITIVLVINSTPEATQSPEATQTPEVTETPEGTETPEATDDNDDDDLPITIVIQGPVQSININIITIYNITIQLDPNDPILQTLQVGDDVDVQGNVQQNGTTIIVVVVNITYVNITVNGGGSSGGGGGGEGMGMGMGDDD
jgi:hypothetical protein